MFDASSYIPLASSLEYTPSICPRWTVVKIASKQQLIRFPDWEICRASTGCRCVSKLCHGSTPLEGCGSCSFDNWSSIRAHAASKRPNIRCSLHSISSAPSLSSLLSWRGRTNSAKEFVMGSSKARLWCLCKFCQKPGFTHRSREMTSWLLAEHMARAMAFVPTSWTCWREASDCDGQMLDEITWDHYPLVN